MSPEPIDRPRVMIVDDDEIVLEVTADWLRGGGYEVIPRLQALGTMAAVIRERPDIILLDVNMPALGGERLAKLIVGLGVTASTVVLYSACPEAQLTQLVRSSGAAGGIQKTSDRSRFLADFAGYAPRRAL